VWTLLRFAFFHIPAVAAIDPYVDDTDPVSLAMAPLIPGSGVWFIYALALFAVIAKLIKGLPVWLQLGAAGLLSAFVGAEIVQFEAEVWTRMARHLFFFLLGWHARALVEGVARAGTALRVAAVAAVCVGCAAAAVVLGVRWIPGVALGLNILAVTFGVLFAAWVSRYRVGRPLVALGAQTLPVYLIHIFWIAVVMVGLLHIGVPPVAGYALPVGIAVLCTVLSLLTHRVLVAAGASWLFALPRRLAFAG
jgi:peptidoglycan/LPS O-acetylase OafA/YrhL